VLLDRVRKAARTEAQAAAQRLVAIGELLVLRCRESGEQPDWALGCVTLAELPLDQDFAARDTHR
jgi:hypothetical protein